MLPQLSACSRGTQLQQTMALHRQHGLSVVDSKSMLGAFAQMPVILAALSTAAAISGPPDHVVNPDSTF
jgi:hypothetical protein